MRIRTPRIFPLLTIQCTRQRASSRIFTYNDVIAIRAFPGDFGEDGPTYFADGWREYEKTCVAISSDIVRKRSV